MACRSSTDPPRDSRQGGGSLPQAGLQAVNTTARSRLWRATPPPALPAAACCGAAHAPWLGCVCPLACCRHCGAVRPVGLEWLWPALTDVHAVHAVAPPRRCCLKRATPRWLLSTRLTRHPRRRPAVSPLPPRTVRCCGRAEARSRRRRRLEQGCAESAAAWPRARQGAASKARRRLRGLRRHAGPPDARSTCCGALVRASSLSHFTHPGLQLSTRQPSGIMPTWTARATLITSRT